MAREKKQLPDVIRYYSENSIKYLMHDGDNVHDLLALLQQSLVPRIDFSQLEVTRTSFILADFRHIESDLLLRAPLISESAKSPSTVDIYLLLEHQSEPDELASYRALRHLGTAMDLQLREWKKQHGDSQLGFRFHPILPIVVYTGSRTWKRLLRIDELVQEGNLIRDHLPVLNPMFFDLAETSTDRLESEAGLLGLVLLLLRVP